MPQKQGNAVPEGNVPVLHHDEFGFDNDGGPVSNN